MKNIIIFKNDRIGDLMHSLEAIYFIIKNNKDSIIHIFLSELNYELKNLLIFKNTKIYKISNKLKIKNKIFLFSFFFKKKISQVFILRSESFFFLLPLILHYKKIKFSAICVVSENYQRPNNFLIKYLNKYLVNDRGTTKVRKSILALQNELVECNYENFKLKKLNNNKNLEEFLPKNYIYFHFNRFKFNERGWDIKELYLILDSLKTLKKKIVISNDINDEKTNILFKKKFSFFENNETFIINEDIFYLPNIKGEEFYNTIKFSDLVIAFHGSITSIAAINDVPVLDIYHMIINNKKDLYKYKNSFHEFKFKKNNYEFTVPSLQISKTIKKIIYLISNGTKLSNKVIK